MTSHHSRDGRAGGLDVEFGRRPPAKREWTAARHVLPVIALGGMLGASGRYALNLLWPTPTAGFPWGTLVLNAAGCLLIGLVMVYLVDVGGAHPVVRPFVGVGILGGFTTFSTYSVQAAGLLVDREPVTALGYLLITAVAALSAVLAGVMLARATLAARRGLDARRRESA